ncbi:MAG: hypothetical protein V4471_03285 [Pseudomonadota bacterium]
MLNSHTQLLNETYQNNSLNLYSLLNFKDILKPLILHSTIQSICEIGIEKSHLTTWLASLSHVKNFNYTGIDPAIDSIPEFRGESKLFKENSLTYLNRPAADHDLFLIDGDHNYYTVYHELQSIFSKKNPKQSICFLHDVLPPCGNRDAYYNPSNIPPNFLHPLTSTKSLNSNFEVCDYGYKSCGEFSWAIESGNQKNGVSAAIKYFLANYKKELDLHYFTIPLFYGLGILYSKKLINPSIQKFLLKKNIYRLLANKNLFQHIETNRIKLYFNLITEQEMKNAKIKEIESIKSSSQVYMFGFLFTLFLKKTYSYILKKKKL